MADGKFIAYYRVSTKRQGASGLGLEAQQAAVSAYLNGGDWTLIDEVKEVETGTRKRHRPELERAIQRCKREKATLVIAKLDRLARNVAFTSALMESGVEFIALDLPGANKFTIHIMAAVAEQQAEQISSNTKAALAAAKARGTKLGNPDNLTVEGSLKGAIAGAASRRRLALEAYADISGAVTKLRADGKSLRAIAEHLNEQGFKTRNGAQFTAATVQRILNRTT